MTSYEQQQYFWFQRQQTLRAAYAALHNISNFVHAGGNAPLSKQVIVNNIESPATSDSEYMDSAVEFFETSVNVSPVACSGMVSKDKRFHGRNLDWYYDSNATVVMKSPAESDKHAVLGVCLSRTTVEEIKSGNQDNPEVKFLPFRLDDGINDAGLTIQINVTHANADKRVTVPKDSSLKLPAPMVVRYVLENCSTAEEAADIIVNHAYEVGADFDHHWLVSDSNNVYIVEDGVAKEISDRPYMTNFRAIEDPRTDDNLSVDFDKISENDPYAMGVERYLTIMKNYENSISEKDIVNLMHNDLKYTNAYAVSSKYPEIGPWYSESCGNYYIVDFRLSDIPNDTNVTLTVEELASIGISVDNDYNGSLMKFIYSIGQSKFENRYRDDDTWITTWTAVYDREKLSMKVMFQEEDIVHEYKLKG